jgi:hypothetical protein
MRRNLTICLFVVVGISLLASLTLIQPVSAEPVTENYASYHLGLAPWQLSGDSSGPGYHLHIPGSPSMRGSGCCCTHLPCVAKP